MNTIRHVWPASQREGARQARPTLLVRCCPEPSFSAMVTVAKPISLISTVWFLALAASAAMAPPKGTCLLYSIVTETSLPTQHSCHDCSCRHTPTYLPTPCGRLLVNSHTVKNALPTRSTRKPVYINAHSRMLAYTYTHKNACPGTL